MEIIYRLTVVLKRSLVVYAKTPGLTSDNNQLNSNSNFKKFSNINNYITAIEISAISFAETAVVFHFIITLEILRISTLNYRINK